MREKGLARWLLAGHRAAVAAIAVVAEAHPEARVEEVEVSGNLVAVSSMKPVRCNSMRT